MPPSKPAKPTIDFKNIALELMFAGKLDFAKHGVMYREGKGRDDVAEALRKARDPKNGHAKTETELRVLEVGLQGVLKAAPVTAPAEAVAA